MRALRHLRALQRRSPRAVFAWSALLAYAALAVSVQLGASVGGQGPDPVWAAARARGTLRVAADLGYYPFTWVEGGRPTGHDIELATLIARRLGLDVEVVPSGLDSIFDDLAARRADLAASALPYTPEQGWRARFSHFYFNAGQVLVVHQGSPLRDRSGLGGLRLGAALGSDGDTWARAQQRSGQRFTLVDDYDTSAEALDALRAGRIDAAVVENVAALTAINGASGLRLAEALTLDPYVLAVAPEAYQLQGEVNRALDALIAEGELTRLGAKWFVPRQSD